MTILNFFNHSYRPKFFSAFDAAGWSNILQLSPPPPVYLKLEVTPWFLTYNPIQTEQVLREPIKSTVLARFCGRLIQHPAITCWNRGAIFKETLLLKCRQKYFSYCNDSAEDLQPGESSIHFYEYLVTKKRIRYHLNPDLGSRKSLQGGLGWEEAYCIIIRLHLRFYTT